MQSDDVATRVRIAGLAKLTRELGQSRTPLETLDIVRRGLEDAYGPSTILILSTRGLQAGEYQVVQFFIQGENCTPESDPWAQDGVAVYRGGMVGGIIGRVEPQLLQEVDWSGDPYFSDRLANYDSVAAIPVFGEHVPIDWVIVLKRSPAPFTTLDFEQSVLRTVLIASLLESQSLSQAVADAHALIDREVKRVGQIQRLLLPDPLPTIPGLQIASSYETFGEAGGDLYDFVSLDGNAPAGGPWAIFIADASGHGPSAAVMIAIVQALLNAHPPEVTGAAALLQHINDHLCRRPINMSFVTAFIGIYEPQSRRLTFSGAGHPPPLLMGAGQAIRRLDSATGYPLGIDADQVFHEASIELSPAEVLLLYTDGIEEARDPGGAMFGIDGIEAAMRCCSRTPDQLVSAIRRAVTSHENGRQAADDQTLVAISVV